MRSLPCLASSRRLSRSSRKSSLSGRSGARWMGCRPTLPDYLPVIGQAPGWRNAFLAFGHQHIGLTAAAATGRIIRDLVAGRPPAVDPGPFSARRFGAG